MKFKSTGLGTTELTGKILLVEKNMTGVFFNVKISKPVVWKVRVFFQKGDLRKLFFLMLKPKNIWYIIKALMTKVETVEEPAPIEKKERNRNGSADSQTPPAEKKERNRSRRANKSQA